MKRKTISKILVYATLIYLLTIATIPLHEGIHWVIHDIEPWTEPKSMVFFDVVLGYVYYEPAYPGAFEDRPSYMFIIHEIASWGIQLIVIATLTLYIGRRTIGYLYSKKQDNKKEKIEPNNFIEWDK